MLFFLCRFICIITLVHFQAFLQRQLMSLFNKKQVKVKRTLFSE